MKFLLLALAAVPLVAPAADFVPARGLSSPHAQTIFAAIRPRGYRLTLTRQRLNLPDDFLDLDWGRFFGRTQPTVLILHGLEGSSRSGCVAELFQQLHDRKWNAVALNFRSCSGPNLLPRFYHHADTADALLVANRLRQEVQGPLFGVGFSLGGNVLLLALAETGNDSPLDAAVAISVPYDLEASVRQLDEHGGWYRLYRNAFLWPFRKKALAKAIRFPDQLDRSSIKSVRTIGDFVETVIAPLHGFPSRAAYYLASSVGPGLGRIRRYTRLIQSEDDPIAPSPIPDAAFTNPYLSVLKTQCGGHCGWVGGSWRNPEYWAERQALEFLSQH